MIITALAGNAGTAANVGAALMLIFGLGAGYTYILHMMQHNNVSPSNTGTVVYWDFLFPVFMGMLYLLYRRRQKL